MAIERIAIQRLESTAQECRWIPLAMALSADVTAGPPLVAVAKNVQAVATGQRIIRSGAAYRISDVTRSGGNMTLTAVTDGAV